MEEAPSVAEVADEGLLPLPVQHPNKRIEQTEDGAEVRRFTDEEGCDMLLLWLLLVVVMSIQSRS